MRKRELLLIEWDDTTTHSGWEPADKPLEVTVNPQHSVGWRVKSPNRKHICISSMIDNVDKCDDRQTIPRGCVRKIRKLAY